MNKVKPIQNHKLHRLATPYLYWLYLFACLPVLIMFCLMFIDTEGVRLENMEFTMYNFTILGTKSVIMAFINSFKYSILTTIICIFFGYLIAYTLYRSKLKNKYLILLILILPMWTNILLRINALASIFKPENILVDIFTKKEKCVIIIMKYAADYAA